MGQKLLECNEIKSFLVNQGRNVSEGSICGCCVCCRADQALSNGTAASRPVAAYLTHDSELFSRSSRADAENVPPHQQIVRKAHMVARGGAVEQQHLGEAEAALIDAYIINVWIAAA